MPTRLSVFISGNGSNLQAIIDAIRMRVLQAGSPWSSPIGRTPSGWSGPRGPEFRPSFTR